MDSGSDTAWARAALTARRVLHFSWRVLADFMANRGLLLAGGVGYNVLLSIVPLFAVFAAMLSYVVDEAQLVSIIRAQARLVAPGQAALLVETVQQFLASRELLSIVGVLALLFFSSLAFRMLDDAMAIIFHRQAHHGARSLWVTVLLPYAFVLVLGIGVLGLTLVVVLANAVSERSIVFPGMEITLSWAPALAMYVLGFAGIGLLFTAIYKVLPATRIAWSRALIGGFAAAGLWELLLRALMYYFDNISLVGAVYGSFATIIVALLCLELGAVILLLGAQIIAELERNAEAGVRWYEDLGAPPTVPGQRALSATRHDQGG